MEEGKRQLGGAGLQDLPPASWYPSFYFKTSFEGKMIFFSLFSVRAGCDAGATQLWHQLSSRTLKAAPEGGSPRKTAEILEAEGGGAVSLIFKVAFFTAKDQCKAFTTGLALPWASTTHGQVCTGSAGLPEKRKIHCLSRWSLCQLCLSMRASSILKTA